MHAMQSTATMTLGKPFFVLKICLRQLHGLLKYFPNFSKVFLRSFENQELSLVFLSFSSENLKPKSDLGTFENWAPGLSLM